MSIRIYLTNLAKYNNGMLVGKWLELPLDEEKLGKELREILGNDEECFITDYEAAFKIGEYENVFELNEFAEDLEKLDEYDQEKIFYLLDCIGLTRKNALDTYDEVTFYPDMTLEDVAEELVEEGIFGQLSDTIKSYFDYEKLANDLSIDGYYETDKGTFWYQ